MTRDDERRAASYAVFQALDPYSDEAVICALMANCAVRLAELGKTPHRTEAWKQSAVKMLEEAIALQFEPAGNGSALQ